MRSYEEQLEEAIRLYEYYLEQGNEDQANNYSNIIYSLEIRMGRRSE